MITAALHPATGLMPPPAPPAPRRARPAYEPEPAKEAAA